MNKQTLVYLGCVFGIPAAILASAYGFSQYKIRAEVERLKQEIASDLYDPEAARFRSLELLAFSGPLALLSPPSTPLLCGEINGKNKLGAYVGYTTFAASDDVREIDFEDGSTVARDICADMKAKEVFGVVYRERG